MEISERDFWRGKKVFLTGHTGFKGSWLCLWLSLLGAKVTGYALKPPTNPNLFDLCRLDELVESVVGDVRDRWRLLEAMAAAEPEIVIHMAAQPLVRRSYDLPADTYATNVMGTVHLFEAVRACRSVKAVVNVTSDKCYENKEWIWGYRENDRLGGYDPYSSSKACAELITAAYRNSFFSHTQPGQSKAVVASGRAGNVIGGGDWAEDRLVPDCIRAFLAGETIVVRNPDAVRPWQHVLEPLHGYLVLSRRLYQEGGRFAGSWNFGPAHADAKPVVWVVNKLCRLWRPGQVGYMIDSSRRPHEAHYLKLDCTKAMAELNWRPRWTLEQALASVIEWTRGYIRQEKMRDLCFKQIQEYVDTGQGVKNEQ